MANIPVILNPAQSSEQHYNRLKSFIYSSKGEEYFAYLNKENNPWDTMGIRLRAPIPFTMQLTEQVPLNNNSALKTNLKNFYNSQAEQIVNNLFERYTLNERIGGRAGAEVRRVVNFHLLRDQLNNPGIQIQNINDSDIRNKLYNAVSNRLRDNSRENYDTRLKNIKKEMLTILKTSPCRSKIDEVKDTDNIKYFTPIFYVTPTYYILWFLMAIVLSINCKYIWNTIIKYSEESDAQFKVITGSDRRVYKVTCNVLLVIIFLILNYCFLYCFEIFRNRDRKWWKIQNVNYPNYFHRSIKMKNMNMGMDFTRFPPTRSSMMYLVGGPSILWIFLILCIILWYILGIVITYRKYKDQSKYRTRLIRGSIILNVGLLLMLGILIFAYVKICQLTPMGFLYCARGKPIV